MKHMTESERILAIFGGLLTVVAVALSLATEINARRYLAEYRQRIAESPVMQQGAPPGFRYVGYEQQTLASRWSFPDGHATLGAGFELFGLILVVVPRAAARKRLAGS